MGMRKLGPLNWLLYRKSFRQIGEEIEPAAERTHLPLSVRSPTMPNVGYI
jgi:hypothetical protein